jgi:hypothetical protein
MALRVLPITVALAALAACGIDPICVEGEDGCSLPACDDTAPNGDESDVDCGGSCAPCGEAMACGGDGDCAAGSCVEGRCCSGLCALWGRSFGSLVDDAAIGAFVRADRSVVVVGAFSGAVDFGGGPLVASGGRDVFVLGLAADGSHLWSERYGGEGDEGDVLVLEGPGDHATLVVQSSSSAVDFGGGAIAATQPTSFLLELDARGKHVRSKAIAPDAQLGTRGMAWAPGGDLVLTGSLYSADLGGGTLSSHGALDVFVARFDAGWQHVWSKHFGDAWHDTGQRVAVDGRGDILVTASYSRQWSFGGAVLPWTGGIESVAIAKLDGEGHHLWSRGFGGGSTGQWPYAVVADGSGEVIVGGVFSGDADFGSGVLSAGIVRSGFVAAFGSDGTPRWSRALGEHTVSVEGLALDGAGGVLVAGVYRGNVDFGGVRLERGLDDVFVAQLDAAGATAAARGFGGAARAAGVGIAAGAEGAVLFGGYREGLTLPAEALASGGGADAFALFLAPSSL